jgi:hypothetical protein
MLGALAGTAGGGMTPNQRQDIDSDDFESGFDSWCRFLIEVFAFVTAVAVLALAWVAASGVLQFLKHHL